jgi:hypothetical protein
MTVCEGEHINVPWFERGAFRIALESPALLSVPCLEPFSSIDDSDAVGPFDQAATDGPI